MKKLSYLLLSCISMYCLQSCGDDSESAPTIQTTLSTTTSDYTAAADSDWVEITEAEYNALAEKLQDVTVNGIVDTLFDETKATGKGAVSFLVASEAATIPANSYVFAFKFMSGVTDTRTADKVKVSEQTVKGTYTTVGKPLQLTGSGTHYFVLKNPDYQTGNNTGYLGFYSSKSTNQYNISGMTNHWGRGDTNTTTGTESINYMFQSLSTTSKQW